MTTATRDQRTKLMVHYPAGNAADPRELQAFLDAVISAVGPAVIIGGTTASSTLTLKSTTGVGTTDAIIFLVGNNGAIEAGRFITGGQLIKGHTASIAATSGGVAPSVQLHGTTDSLASASLARWSNDANTTNLYFLKSRGASAGSRSVVSADDIIGALSFRGDDGTNFIPAGAIRVDIDGTPGTNDMPGRMVFFTTADGASGVTERARMDKAGNVVINTAAIATSATDGFLYVPSCAGVPTGTPTTYTGRIPVVVDTSNKVLRFYSSGWNPAWVPVPKTADEPITTNTTLQNDDHLFFAMAASTKYAIRVVMWVSSNNTADFKFGFTGPASPSHLNVYYRTMDTGDAAETNMTVVQAYDTTGVAWGMGATAEGVLMIDAIVHNGTNAGNFQITWAQNTSSGTSTVRAGSYLEWMQI